MKEFTIARLVLRKLRGLTYMQELNTRKRFLLKECAKLKKKVTVIQTPGGTLPLTLDMRQYSRGVNSTEGDFREISKIAETNAFRYFFTPEIRRKLKKACLFVTLGVDLNDDHETGTHVELVGVYDAQRQRFLRWTGKSYPLASQAQTLIYCQNLDSHFIKLHSHTVLVLGCHDLNMFSPRGLAQVSKQSYKGKTSNRMIALVKKYKPTIVLQHPHRTDSPNIWAMGWIGVRRLLPSCMYSSGINYEGSPRPRRKLPDVLRGTAMGKITDWIQPDKK